ncbi:MAG: class I SAM-dependent methyltransferase [Candidatus Neomarinimicrobiota bacterium]
MTRIITALPMWTKNLLRPFRDIARAIYYYGNERICPVCCKSSRRFNTVGYVPRKDAQCVRCGALERHRFLWLYLSRKTDIFDGQPKKMLHIAPEKCFESRFKKLFGDNYLTADLFNPHVMVKMDITNIEYAAESFDIIYCSHVLEHVQDDKKAMREINRVLKNDGWAILLVPITVEKTFEDPSIIDPVERLKYFGQENHVRRYGIDYIDRLREAGFIVEISKVSDLVRSDEVVKMGLTSASGNIYYCTK